MFRRTLRALTLTAGAALCVFACSLDDADYVFGGEGEAGEGGVPATSSGGANQGRGGTTGGSPSSGPGGDSSVGPAPGGARGDAGDAAVGGSVQQSGGAPASQGGTSSASGGNGGGAPATGGTGSDPVPTDGCQPNQICATLTVGSEFPSDVQRVAVVLYENEPVITELGPPWPLATYAPIPDVELSEDESFVLQQDFTQPAWGGDPLGQRYIAVVAFFSNEERQGRPGVDYWSISAEPVAIEPGKAIDLGQIKLTLIPVVDDSDTPGNDAAGVVFCIARLHEQGVTGHVCDVSERTCCIFPVDGGTCDATSCADDGNESEHACDGPEDCARGEVCCGEPLKPHRCVAEASCKAKRACHSSGDCETAASVCVPSRAGYADVGYCVTADPATPGDDRPGMVQCTPSATVCSAACCVNVTTSTVVCGMSGCGSSSPNDDVNILKCDGHEDCLLGNYCCRSASGDQYCVDRACSVSTVCHTDDDCPEGTCGADGLCSP